MLPVVDWTNLEEASTTELISGVFDVLQIVSWSLQNNPIGDSGVCEIVPRMLQLRQARPELKKLDEAIGTLARSVGLWNYLDDLTLEPRDQIVGQAATARSERLGNRILHKEQWQIFDRLLQGKNVILSAPTSFGKSLLIDVLIASRRYQKIAIIVPTLALLDETRKRLLRAFGDIYEVISHSSEVPETENVIYIGTQERLIVREGMTSIDLLVVDEFYKLDPARRDERSTALNAVVYKLLQKAKQFFFLGPNIDSVVIKESSLWKFEFIQTRFSTVAVDTLDLRGENNKTELLLGEVGKPSNWPALIFASSPDRANQLLATIMEAESSFENGSMELANWMSENYWQGWTLCHAVKTGCAVHHARLPRALSVKFVREFGRGGLDVLICTSTLIEGVNTAAKSVMIFDKKIVGSDYDFFTFANIRGRAGRLGRHYVGKVLLFNDPPDETKVDIDTPLFGDLNEAPDRLIVHFETESLSEVGNGRVEVVAAKTGLNASELQRFSSVSIDEIQKYNELVDQAARTGQLPTWTGYPSSYMELEAVCELVCSVKNCREFGAYSYKQLAFYINKLRHSRSMKDFYEWYGDGLEDAEDFDQIFKFLKSCEFGIGEYFSLIETLVRKRTSREVDYSPFVAEMKNLFRPECIKVLDERGVPIQISEKIYRRGDDLKSLTSRLLEVAMEGRSSLTAFESAWIIQAVK